MKPNQGLMNDLTAHLARCQEALQAAEKENACLRAGSPVRSRQTNESRRQLLARLSQSLDRLRKVRADWHQLPVELRQHDHTTGRLLRANQDLLQRAIVLSRDTERLCLEHGLFAAGDLPPANAQRPHFVRDLYSRNTGSHF